MKFETLQKDMIAAMKARDKERKDVISSMIADVKKVAIDEGTRDEILSNHLKLQKSKLTLVLKAERI